MNTSLLTVARRTALVALLALAPACVGCSGKADPPRVPVFPVAGKLKVGSETPVGATVTLHPTSGANGSGVSPQGTVAKDGSFKVTTYDPGDGAPVGDYVVTVQWYKIQTSGEGAGVPGPNVIPKNYTSAEKSPLKVTINSAPNDLGSLEVKR